LASRKKYSEIKGVQSYEPLFEFYIWHIAVGDVIINGETKELEN
jgi:hypothetical protein